ncbi:RluA family pseudouridine synthase [Candidatus Neptunochlamydia vexilliferae]|uniref:RluA family pseudouridine synthase n=1 Tax=Candidatus Neptunichlamydia vexilliferae TaxID=1651774 RepID=UPI0018915201|nr:RluA family pseudouridine synthase [Candidatus Neptunochlamydia vexilliferae]
MFVIKVDIPLLNFLKEKTNLSGRAIKQALEQGGCRVNGTLERFASTKLKKGDKVSFRLPKKTEVPSLTILRQEPTFTLFNKPSGIVTAAPPGHHLVHRLDKRTSGVLLMARTLPAKKALEAAFKKREVKKVYIALVKGIPRKTEGTIENTLVKKGAFQGQTLYGSARNGKLAITHWKVLKKQKGCSLIELHPETGRTHQLRVHMAEMGHPILGDLQYGRQVSFSPEIDRLCLYAYRLTFPHPQTGKKVQVTAPLPKGFKLLLDR